jgi:hypothetical protein
MACKRTFASKAALPRTVDDLKHIHGIGPIIEKRLHGAGIYTFAQIASLSPEEITSRMPKLSVNQVKKLGWISQARKLAPIRGKPVCKKEAAIAVSRQHYENFTFEFLLDEKNKIHRLRMVHVQSGDVDTWAEWNTERLMAFLAWHTGACLPCAKPVMPTTPKTEHLPAPATSPSPPSRVIEEITSLPQIPVPIGHPSPEAAHPQLSPPPASTKTSSQIHLLEWKTLLAGTNQPVRDLFHDQAFDVRLMLDLSNTSLPGEPQLDFTTKLYAKKMGGGPHQLVSETQITVPYSKTVNLTIRGIALSQGLYRLEALLTLIPTEASLIATHRMEAVFPGGLLQIY